MLFEPRLREGIADGSITVAFRRWKRAQAVTGHRYRTGSDIIEMDAVDVVAAEQISAVDATAAGYPSAAAAIAALQGDPSVPLYRLRFHRVDEPDPRAELAASADLSPADVAEIAGRLERLDLACSHGPWTSSVLRLIAERPAVRAPDLAASLGRETQPFKRDVRKLKELGLTRSLDVGYEISPRGRAYLG